MVVTIRSSPRRAPGTSWSQPDLHQLSYEEVLDRIADGDPLAPMADPEALGGSDRDRLAQYRSMRDAAKTPEPVPTSRARGDRADDDKKAARFVIQEHHARRLHYDFRLERDGVLVSWAVPKAPPTDPEVNHLAVQTEDHPLEYADLRGLHPEGRVRRWRRADLGLRVPTNCTSGARARRSSSPCSASRTAGWVASASSP